MVVSKDDSNIPSELSVKRITYLDMAMTLNIISLYHALSRHVVQITSSEDHCAVIVDTNPSPIRQAQYDSFNNHNYYRLHSLNAFQSKTVFKFVH